MAEKHMTSMTILWFTASLVLLPLSTLVSAESCEDAMKCEQGPSVAYLRLNIVERERARHEFIDKCLGEFLKKHTDEEQENIISNFLKFGFSDDDYGNHQKTSEPHIKTYVREVDKIEEEYNTCLLNAARASNTDSAFKALRRNCYNYTKR